MSGNTGARVWSGVKKHFFSVYALVLFAVSLVYYVYQRFGLDGVPGGRRRVLAVSGRHAGRSSGIRG